MHKKLISKKKPTFPVQEFLYQYLKKYNRYVNIPVFYDDLLRFSGAIAVYDKYGRDTLWVSVYYSDSEREELDESLKKIYAILFSDGDTKVLKYLNVDAVDYCTFGNSKPFRIKIRNVLNDNYTYFYVKKADASRVYGLELEHILSPNRISFLVHGDTLIEEHIAGIPGDVFIENKLEDLDAFGKTQLAKEFVKFNERCLMLLLGDMRSYNYVIIPTHDFDQVKYKIRAIDFDQECYEGNLKVYQPHFFKENRPMVKLVEEKLEETSVEQYRREERSLLAKRILSSQSRLRHLIRCMSKDQISTFDKVKQLRKELYQFTYDMKFKRSKNMGLIVKTALEFVKRNYEDLNPGRFGVK